MHLYRSRLDFYKPWLMKADEKADWYRLSPGGRVFAGEAELGQK
jgi:hypothetical protein